MLGKRLINSNDAAAGGACTTNTNDYPITNVAYYKMSSAADEKDTYNGTATDVNFNVQGKFGNAGEFNGSSSYIDTNLSLNSLTDYTISLWLNPTGGDFFGGTINSSAKNGFYFQYSSNVLYWVEVNASAAVSNLTITGAVNTGSWNHIVFVRSGGTNYIYVNNGTPVSVSNGSYTHASDFILGKAGAFATSPIIGSIDQVRIFDSALDATQVASLYNEVYCVPTIVPSDNFTPITYTGTGGAQSTNSLSNQVGSIDFAPDLVWVKKRNTVINHFLVDSLRPGKYLSSDTTNAESPASGLSLSANGFNLTLGGTLYNSTGTYVAWNWKAGGAAVSNTDGTITSQVSANVDAGFSIATFTTPATNNFSIGHGLNSEPELVFLKSTSGGSSWTTYTQPTGATKYLFLNSTAAATTSALPFNNTAPTDSVINLGSATVWYGTSADWVAYAFHSVDGYSKIGSFVGNGSTVNVVTGFRPAFVMWKNTTQGSASYDFWFTVDNKRSPSNPVDKVLYPNDSSSEDTTAYTIANLNSNGFDIVGSAGGRVFNNSGDTYIFMAFAEEALPYVTRNATDPFGDSSEVALYKFEDNATNSEDNVTAASTNVTYTSGYIDKAANFKTLQGNIISPVGIYSNSFSGHSVSLWMKSGGTNYETPLWTRTSTAAAAGWHIRTSTGGNGINWSWQNSSGGVVFGSGEESFTFTDGWHHVVASWDGTTSANAAKLYIDGNLFGQLTPNATLASQTFTLGATLGADRQSSGRSILGLDQVRIFNRTLDDGEVTALYNE